jgi:hypothetical protein
MQQIFGPLEYFCSNGVLVISKNGKVTEFIFPTGDTIKILITVRPVISDFCDKIRPSLFGCHATSIMLKILR